MGYYALRKPLRRSRQSFLVRACLVGRSTFKNAGIEHGTTVGDEAVSRIEKALDKRVGDRVCHIPEKCIANEQGFERREG